MSNLPPVFDSDQEPANKGPNLFVLYALLLFGILAAMVVAAMVVWPFYKAR